MEKITKYCKSFFIYNENIKEGIYALMESQKSISP